MKPLNIPFAFAVLFSLMLSFSQKGKAQISSRDYLPVPAGCVNIGPNLVINPEFEEGNQGFISSFFFRPDGVCYWGDYTIARSVNQPQNNCYDVPPTYIPSRDFPSYRPGRVPFNLTHIWTVSHRFDSRGNPFPGTGLFMIVDPCDPLSNSLTDSCSATDPSDGRIWQQTIEVCAGENYAFSVFAKNIYAADAFQWPGAGVQPDFELSINGNAISNYFVDGVPGQNGSFNLPQNNFEDSTRWFQISGVYNSPPGVDTATLVIRNLVQGKDGNDLAIDGLFFGLCGKSIELNITNDIPQCSQNGNFGPITIRANTPTQNSGWRYYEWTKDGLVRDSGVLNVGTQIPDYVTDADFSGQFFGEYQLITYADVNPSSSCGNASQSIRIVDDCTVPVEMGNFTGEVLQRKAKLRWETLSELNNRGFKVQISEDGKSYETIGFVEGKGSSQQVHSYEFTTGKLSLGKYLFRLQQIDFDGTIHLSNKVELTIRPSDLIFEMYPNPSKGLTRVELEVLEDDFLDVQLISPMGQVVEQIYQGPISKGEKVVREINSSKLASGVYQVRLRGSQAAHTYRLMVMH